MADSQQSLPPLTEEEMDNISLRDLIENPELAARLYAYLVAQDPSFPQQLEAFCKKVEALEPPTFT